jgi:hypothetical protein
VVGAYAAHVYFLSILAMHKCKDTVCFNDRGRTQKIFRLLVRLFARLAFHKTVVLTALIENLSYYCMHFVSVVAFVLLLVFLCFSC